MPRIPLRVHPAYPFPPIDKKLARLYEKMMKPLTIMDIAKEAGVSKSTVSRVLSKSIHVSDGTRETVRGIIAKHGYLPNHLAQGLAGTPTKVIGVVIDELANYFFIELTEGIDSVVSEENYSLQLSSSKWIPEKELQIVRSLITGRVDGILLAPVDPNSESIDVLSRSGVPFVLMNCEAEKPGISSVSCDNVSGGRIAAQHINSIEKDQTIVISGYPHQSVTKRLEGFTTMFNGSDGGLIHYPNIRTFDEGYEIVPVIIEENEVKKKKTAIAVMNDNVAIGVITHLLELGISIPEQVTVIGYDDIKLAAFSPIPLTTVSQSIREMGHMAAKEILRRIKEPDSEARIQLIQPKLIPRRS